MWKQYFADHPAAQVALLSMAIFMALFFVAVVYAMRKPRGDLSAAARLPLEDAPQVSFSSSGVQP